MASLDDSLLNDALTALRAGAVQQAEKPLRRILRRQPDHAVALNILGVALSQQQRYAEAETCLARALALQPPSATTLYNHGLVLRALQRPAEALTRFEAALAREARAAEIWNAQGATQNDLKRPAAALASFDRALQLDPSSIEAAFNKANALQALHRHGEALALYDQLLRARPQWPELCRARGNALWQLGLFDAARSAFERALALDPQLQGAAIGLGRLLLERGSAGQAFACAQRALAQRDSGEARALAAACLQSPALAPETPGLLPVLRRAMAEVWTRPSTLAPLCARVLMADPAGPRDHPLLAAALENMPVMSPQLEAFVTAERRRLLSAALAGALPPQDLRLARIIALQAFLTAYVFAETAAEAAGIAQARDMFGRAPDGAAAESLLLVLAAYAPLSALFEPAAILARPWSELAAPVLEQQLRAWQTEQALRPTVPTLTGITDTVSQDVRSQYEESPYPHWAHLETAAASDLATLLHDLFPQTIDTGMDWSDAPQVLIAGCGTGRFSIQLALQLPQADVLAIDLSLTSLSYAKRQAQARRIANVDYAQADITRLAALDRRFDMIESSGVLHHLADPFAGWRVLLGLLKPGGVMRLAFYSEIARRDVVAGRAFIAARGYGATPADIRRCRQDILALGGGDGLSNLTGMADFYNLNDVRDLLFHVQEHRLTLPEIAAFLAEEGLTFLGFELDAAQKRRYAQRSPADTAMTDLGAWHRFETENPYTFVAMYQFWVQKRR